MSQGQATILLVEDNEPTRNMLSRRLGQEGYVVSAAENGRVALELMQVERYDLVLLDLIMPEMDGLAMLRHLAARSSLQSTPTIVVTAVNSRDAVSECVQLGAADYVVKPIDLVTLKTRMWRCLERRRLTQGLSTSTKSTGAVAGRVLIVDDNSLNRELLSLRVGQIGCQCVCANDGQAALVELESAKYDLVLLDIMMPGLDGYQVLENIRNRSAMRSLPVVMLSAVTDQEAIRRCFELGADDYINKPFSAAELRVRITSCIELKKLQDKEATMRVRMDELAQLGAEITRKS